MTRGHAPTETIADYAAGALSPGMTLLVASHLAWCPDCRDKATRLEALGGALLADGPRVPPSSRCLKGALARIEADRAPAPRPAEPALPRPLCRCMATAFCDLRWQAVMPGLTACALDGFPRERVGLLRGDPGVAIRFPGPAGEAGALVLAGRLRGGAATYGCGDLALPGPAGETRQQVVGGEPCLCLVVQPAGA